MAYISQIRGLESDSELKSFDRDLVADPTAASTPSSKGTRALMETFRMPKA